jgi:hypothetical protein
MKLKLLALLKYAMKWVFNFLTDNKIADNEARLYFREVEDESNKK